MFLHIGCDVDILDKDLIAILDIKVFETAEISNKLLKIAKKNGNVFFVSEKKPKSVVITQKDKVTSLYYSPISSITLNKRLFI